MLFFEFGPTLAALNTVWAGMARYGTQATLPSYLARSSRHLHQVVPLLVVSFLQWPHLSVPIPDPLQRMQLPPGALDCRAHNALAVA